MQPEGSRRHRYSSNVCGNRAFLRTESHTARRGSCFLFFYTRPQIVITILFSSTQPILLVVYVLTNHTSGRPVQHVTHAWPAMKCHAKRNPCLFDDGTSPIGKKPSMHPYPTKLRFRFPGSSAVSFFPLLRPLYYSLRTFSLAVFVHRFFFFISSSFFVFFFTGYTLFAFAIVHMCIYISKC